MNGRLGAAGIAVLVSAGVAAAQPRDDASDGDRVVETPSTCTRGEVGALSEVACEIVKQLPGIPLGPLVVAAPVESKAQLPQPGRLEERLAAVIAGRLPRGKAAREAANLAVARSMASEAGTLLHLTPVLAEGVLRVEADVYPVPARFWDRVRDPRPSPMLHAFAERPLDPELRSYLPTVALVARATLKAKSPEQSPLALACADVDLDGSVELVVVGRRSVHLARIRRNVVEPFASQPWSDLAPISPTPLREPIGAVSVRPGRYIDVGISDRAQAIRFDPRLQVLKTVGRRVPWPGGNGCSRFVALVVGPQLHPCMDADEAPHWQTFGWGTDAIAGATLLGRDGRAHRFTAGRIANKAEVVLRDDARQEAKVQGVGAQLALGDLDGDGRPELLSGADTLRREEDAVTIHTWKGDGSTQERLRIDVPLGVDALAVCPQPETSPAPIAIAAGREIWIVQ